MAKRKRQDARPEQAGVICSPIRLPTFHPRTEDVLVVIETTKGERNKYKFDETLRIQIRFSIARRTDIPIRLRIYPGNARR